MPQDRQVTMVPPGAGRAYWLAGDLATIKLNGEETRGAFTGVEIVIRPGGGPPPHLHHREDEAFFVLEGEFDFLAGDRTVRAVAGAVVLGPREIPHTYKNVGSGPGRLLVVASPSGFEQFVAEAGLPVTDPSTPPPPPGPAELEQLVKMCAKYGIEILQPPPG